MLSGNLEILLIKKTHHFNILQNKTKSLCQSTQKTQLRVSLIIVPKKAHELN